MLEKNKILIKLLKETENNKEKKEILFALISIGSSLENIET